MIVDIQTRRPRTIGQLRAFVEGNEAVDFQPRDRDEAYGFVRDTLERFGYRRLGKRDKGVVLRFLVAATGISLKPTERLVRQWRETGAVRDRRGGGRGRPDAVGTGMGEVRIAQRHPAQALEQRIGQARQQDAELVGGTGQWRCARRRRLQTGVVAQRLVIVEIFATQRQHVQALPHHRRQLVKTARLAARIVQRAPPRRSIQGVCRPA